MEAGELYNSIIENMPMGLSMVDREGTIVEFNRAAEKITGHTRSEAIGRSHLEMLHGTDDAGACPLFRRVLKSGEKTEFEETVIKSKSGGDIPAAVTSFPVYDEKGELSGGVELFRDITEQKKTERERKNFLSMFVHDMKNAIIPVQGFLTRMIEGKAGPLTEKQQEYLDLMKVEMNKFETFVKDFLEFSKFEAKKYKPVFKDFRIDRALKKNIESVALEAEKKDTHISCDTACSDIVISADATMINRVIMNLLNNAVKYTRRGGKIHVSCSTRNGSVVVEVKNPGATFSQELIPHVFDAFFRSGKDKRSAGLGLAISKKIIDMHNGTIRVNVTEDRETVFSFALPVRQTRS